MSILIGVFYLDFMLILCLLFLCALFMASLRTVRLPSLRHKPVLVSGMYVKYCDILLVCGGMCLLSCRLRIREKDSYALSISFRSVTKHYRIDKTKVAGEEKWAIEDGPKFDNLMDVRHSSRSLLRFSLK